MNHSNRYRTTADLWNQGAHEGAMILAHRPIFGQPNLEPTVIKGSRIKLLPVQPGEDIGQGFWLGQQIIVALEYLRQ